jgi:dipeptidyl aminopeptidase/acylaminoacyl peptidase
MRNPVGIMTAVVVGMSALGARAAPAPLEAYGRLPNIAVDQFELSPNGDRLAFVAATPQGRSLVVSDLAGHVLMSFATGKVKIRALEWAGNDHFLLTTSATIDTSSVFTANKSELSQVLIGSLTTGKAFFAFRNKPYTLPYTFGNYGFAEKGGHTYAFLSTITTEGSGSAHLDMASRGTITHGWTGLYRVDLDTSEIEKVAGGSEHMVGWAIAPDGSIAGHAESDDRTGEWRLYADPADKQLVYKTVKPIGGVGFTLGRRPGTLLLVAEGAPDTEIDTTKVNAKTELFKEYGDTVRYLHSVDGFLVGVEVEADQPYSVFLDPSIQVKYEAATKPFKGKTITYVSADRNWNKWLLFTQGGGDSGTFYLVDLTTHKAEVEGTAYPDIDTPDVGPSKVIHYKAADGTELEGILTLPNGKDPKGLPMVVMPHGGPVARDYLGFDWWAQAFAHRGYAVFQPNYRGSSGFGLAFRDSGFGEWGRKMQTDISDGVAELARQGVIDPKRACIVGASYGGYAALAGVTVQHGLYRCAVSVAGVSDLYGMLKEESAEADTSNNAGSRFWRKFMGARSDGDPALRAYSPVSLAAGADAPILLIHGTDDTVVSIQQSRDMAKALRGAGKPVEYVELKGEDHWESSEPARIQTLLASVAFVEKYNPAQ